MAIHYYVGVTPSVTRTRVGRDKHIVLQTLDEAVQTLNRGRVVKETTIVHLGPGVHAWSHTLGPLQLQADLLFIGSDAGTENSASGTIQPGSTKNRIETGLDTTDDAFWGATLEVTTNGTPERRSVTQNLAAGQVVPACAFTDTPAPGDSWRIFRPATSLLGTGDGYSPFIQGVGTSAYTPVEGPRWHKTPSLYLINVSLGAPSTFTPWAVASSSVVLCGVQLQYFFVSDGASDIQAGNDLYESQLVGPVSAGLTSTANQWRGWGVSQDPTAYAGIFRATRFRGHCVLQVSNQTTILQNASWWVLGGALTNLATLPGSYNTGQHALVVDAGSNVTIGVWQPNAGHLPVRIEQHSEDAFLSAVLVSGSSRCNIVHATITKHGDGIAILVATVFHADTSPGRASISGDSGKVRIAGVSGIGTPRHAVAVAGGARLNWHNSYMPAPEGAWLPNQQFAVYGGGTNFNLGPDVAQDYNAFTADGDKIIATDGSTIQRY